MKKYFNSGSKFFLMGAAMATGLVFTSCSADDDLDAASQASTNVQPTSTDLVYSFTDANGNSIAMNINGTDVRVSNNSALPEKANAKLEFTNSYKGNLTVNDNTFSTKQIPFTKSEGVLRLDFNGTDNFNGSTVFLTMDSNGTMRSSTVDPITAAISTTTAQNLMKTASKAIIKEGIKAIFPSVLANITCPLLDVLLPNTVATDPAISKSFQEIEDKLNDIDTHINNLSKAIHQHDLTEEYKSHWELTKNMLNNVRQTKELLSVNPDDSLTILKDFARDSFRGNTMSAYLETIIEGYFTSFGGTCSMQNIDEYLVTSYPFLSYSTAERYFFRTEDLKAVCETTQLMYRYWLVNNCTGSAEILKNKLETFMEKYAVASRFDAHPREIVCTIPDAYCAMDLTVGTKHFGEKEFESGRFYAVNMGYKVYETKGFAYLPSYIFSDKYIGDRQTELMDKCLKYDEAEVIRNYFNNRSLYDILTDEGLTGLDNKDRVMLLGDWYNYESERGWGNFKYHVHAKVWDNKNNCFNTNYEVDCLVRTGKNFSMSSHNTNSYAYYTKCTEHFYKTENGKQVKDYDAFMRYIWKDPGEDASDNPIN